MAMAEERKKIFEALAGHEQAIGDLYRLYAEMFPRLSKFFNGLAGEEDGHASWVRQLAQAADEAVLGIDGKRFNLADLDAALKNVAALREAAKDEDFSVKGALAAAFKLENSLLESRYFEVLKDDAVALGDLLNKLARATQIHRDKIKSMIENVDRGL
jgi:rubrerythrin